jgi:hypothetical protein
MIARTAPTPSTRTIGRSPALALWLIAVIALLPFAVSTLPSMTDLPGHIGRFHVMLAGETSPWLARYWAFDWRLVGNLGIDLLVRVLAPLGAERAAWATSALIAPLTVLGIALVSRTLHGRVQASAVAAGVFVLANPLMFGFVNYAFACALALLVFAAWIALRERPALRQLVLLTPAATAVWLAHAMGWGVLVLLVAGFELERLWRRRTPAALGDAVLRGLAVVPPLVLTLAWRGDGGPGGPAFGYGSDLIVRKAMNWLVLLRGEAKWIDLGTPALIGLIVAALWWKRIVRPDPRLATGAVLIALACCTMPTTVFASWGADERLAPVAVIAVLASLRWEGSRRLALAFAALCLALFGLRTAMIARDWHRLDAAYASHLAGLERLPVGARIHAIVLQNGCQTAWASSAYNHLPSLAIARRDALVNSEWKLPGAALLSVRHPLAPQVANDPSQLVTGYSCTGPVDAPLAKRLADPALRPFQYLWLLQTHGRDWLPGRTPLYRDANSALYALPTG